MWHGHFAEDTEIDERDTFPPHKICVRAFLLCSTWVICAQRGPSSIL
jgi:hypothetical protein